MDGTIYFPPVYIKFRKQAARGMEVDCKRNGSGLEADWKRTITTQFINSQEAPGNACSDPVLKVFGDS